MKKLLPILLAIFCAGCVSSPWKIHGGPAECSAMCKNWNLEFTGMVGVGNQDRSGEGATACICQVPRGNASLSSGDAAASASLAAPITAAQAAIAAQMAM